MQQACLKEVGQHGFQVSKGGSMVGAASACKRLPPTTLPHHLVCSTCTQLGIALLCSAERVLLCLSLGVHSCMAKRMPIAKGCYVSAGCLHTKMSCIRSAPAPAPPV